MTRSAGSSEGARLAEEALRKAVTLDPNDFLTYALLGCLYLQLESDRAAVAPFYEKAGPDNLHGAIQGHAQSANALRDDAHAYAAQHQPRDRYG
jgi:hypothetical protein